MKNNGDREYTFGIREGDLVQGRTEERMRNIEGRNKEKGIGEERKGNRGEIGEQGEERDEDGKGGEERDEDEKGGGMTSLT